MGLIFKFLSLILCGVFISGCTVIDQTSVPHIGKKHTYTGIDGIYHSVKRGETLWRISRMYAADLNKLADFNKITDSCRISVGEKIFIPDSLRQDKYIKKSKGPATEFTWPYHGALASCFNQYKQNIKNQGIDIIAKQGTHVNAAAAGNVIFVSENMRGYGKIIIIQHKNDFTTIYAYNQKNLVSPGAYVKQGQVIARAGATGRANQGLVHFELRKNNKAQNPLYYLP